MKTPSRAASAMFLALASPAAATDAPGTRIELPSGAELRWLETLQDSAGGSGLTYRFRFLMPDLAARVPSTSGSATEPELAERPPIEIDTEAGGDASGDDYIDDGLVDIDELQLSPVPQDAGSAPEDLDAAEIEADGMIEDPALPAAPDVLAQDPVHDDIVWLCENWVLPRIASPAPRPQQIVISIADKDIPFGIYDPEVLQLFEAFRLPPDRDSCEWEPW
ncbi:DUF6497 family protein [Paracoccus ravus]|uniref:DUF6497 family protein n=1 Tax=Paracoccus ravus TaxID=2447760 RepID=UPI00106E85B0|nr:DUF6497 family protein [Paracoccus ravus]